MTLGTQLALDLVVKNSNFAAEDLVITPSNDMVYRLIEAWPQWPSALALIVGPERSGKTHFATLWQRKASALLVPADDLSAAIKAVDHGQSIILENLHEAKIDEVAFFHLLNLIKEMQLHGAQVSLLMTACEEPDRWNIKLPDLLSRLRLAPRAFLRDPDDNLFQAVLTKLFADKQILVDQEVILYSLSKLGRSLAMASKLVNKVDHMAIVQKRKISKALIQQAINALETEARPMQQNIK